MPIIVFPRQSNTCPNGSDWHNCNNNQVEWTGCCRTGVPEPCSNGCKAEDVFPVMGSSPTTTSQTQTPRQATSVAKSTIIQSTIQTTTEIQPISIIRESQTSSQVSTTTAQPSTSGAGTFVSQFRSTFTSTQPTTHNSNNPDAAQSPLPPQQNLNNTPNPVPAAGKSPNTGPIIGGIAGAIAIALSIAALVFLFRHRRAKKRFSQHHVIPYTFTKEEGSTTSSSSSGSPTTAQGTTVAEKKIEEFNAQTEHAMIAELPAFESFPSNPKTMQRRPSAEMPFGSKTMQTRLLAELPGSINIVSPPSNHAELPGSTLESPPWFGKSTPSHSRNNTARSLLPRPGTVVSKNDQNSPHIMSWATFDDGFGGTTKSSAILHLGGGVSTLEGMQWNVDGVADAANLKGKSLESNKELDWSLVTGTRGGREGDT